MLRIFKSNSLNKIRSSFWLISFGKIQWWKHTKNQLFMSVVRVKNYWKNFKNTTKNFKKFKRKCKITSKSSVLLFLDFISCQMMNFWKFFLKQETHMPFRHISENVLITLTELSLQMLRNPEKLFQCSQQSHKPCHKWSSFQQVFSLKVQLSIGWWRFNKWW